MLFAIALFLFAWFIVIPRQIIPQTASDGFRLARDILKYRAELVRLPISTAELDDWLSGSKIDYQWSSSKLLQKFTLNWPSGDPEGEADLIIITAKSEEDLQLVDALNHRIREGIKDQDIYKLKYIKKGSQ